MAQLLVKRLLSTWVGGLLYNAYKSGYVLIYWSRYGMTRRLPTRRLPPDRMSTRVKLHGRRVTLQHRRSSKSDANAILQCFAQAQYNVPSGPHSQAIAQLYRDILASNQIPLIIDCGANIGASVAWFAVQYPKAHIVAVEPAPGNYDLLRKNTAGFDVDLREAGIAAEDGNAFLTNASGEDMAFSLTQTPTAVPVRLISIQTLLAAKPDYTPFLLKVDIEGAEKDLFTGDLSGIASFPVIIVEPHDWLDPGGMISRNFFRFHAAEGRDFAMNHENVISIASSALAPSFRQTVIAGTGANLVPGSASVPVQSLFRPASGATLAEHARP